MEMKKCKYCGTVIDCDGCDEENGQIWTCEECQTDFCERCFEKVHGLGALLTMLKHCDAPVLCPDCFAKGHFGELWGTEKFLYYEISFTDTEETICIRAVREPSVEEANDFLWKDIVRLGYGEVSDVSPISEYQAREEFDFLRIAVSPVFGREANDSDR